jgi:hypothetical protein
MGSHCRSWAKMAYTEIARDFPHFFYMRWIVSIFLVLATLSMTSAYGAPVHPAKAHRHAVAAAPSAPKAQRLAARTRTAKRATRDVDAVQPAPRHAAKTSSKRAREQDSASRQQTASRGDVAPRKRNSRTRQAVVAEKPNPQPVVKAAPQRSNVRMAMPPPLRGSHDSLVRQNMKTEADGLERILNDEDLRDRIARKMLVPVPVSSALMVNATLPQERRYCRPWTSDFLIDLSRAHAARFHHSLDVTSAVRTVEYQKRLMGTNGNAAAAEGDVASPHLTGGTIDIAKQGMNMQELAWMRAWLLPRQNAGKIDVEEEFQQACFHITVYRGYAPMMTAPIPMPALVQVQETMPVRRLRKHKSIAPSRIVSRGRSSRGARRAASRAERKG